MYVRCTDFVTLKDVSEKVYRFIYVCPAGASVVSLPNEADDAKSVPPPPPPLPPLPLPLPLLPPTTPHIARRASLQDHKVEDRKKMSSSSQKSTGDMLRDIDNVKLRPVAR